MFDKIKKNLKDFFIIVLVLIIIILVLIFRGVSSNNVKNETKEKQAQTEEKGKNFIEEDFYTNIILEGKGNDKSGRYVTVLSDYACPWSSKFYFDTISGFLKQGDVNKVWLQYDFLVLKEDSPSMLPTEAAYCADEQGKFWEFHDGVFKLKDKFEDIEEAFSEENINALAKNIGVYNTRFQECVKDHKYRQLITMRANYYLDAMDKLGVPSTFLNGKPLTLLIEGKEQAVGAIDLVTFNQKIQEWLKKN